MSWIVGASHASFDQALTLDPKNAKAWNNKGRHLAASGRGEEAVVCYDRALALDQRLVGVWYNKALVEEQAGKGENAARVRALRR